jgi:hypothetical protein
MPTKKQILECLPAFRNKTKLLVDEQTAADIINQILLYHKKNKPLYQQFAMWFWCDGESLEENLRYLYEWLKSNTQYKAESEGEQYINSPQAILQDGNKVDCKSYAAFIGGVLSVWQDYGLVKKYSFCFTCYDGSSQPQHVYILADGFVLDCCMSDFNEEKKYTSIIYKDMEKNKIGYLSEWTDEEGVAHYDEIEEPVVDEPAPDEGDLPDGWKIDDDGDSVDPNGDVYDKDTGDLKGHYDDDGDFVDLDSNVYGNDGELKGHYDDDGDFVDLDSNVYGNDGELKGHYDDDGDFVDLDSNVYGKDGEFKGYYDDDGDFVDLDSNVYGKDGELKGHYDSDGDFVDLDNKVYGKDGELKGSYDKDGNFTDLEGNKYNPAGNLIKRSTPTAKDKQDGKSSTPTGGSITPQGGGKDTGSAVSKPLIPPTISVQGTTATITNASYEPNGTYYFAWKEGTTDVKQFANNKLTNLATGSYYVVATPLASINPIDVLTNITSGNFKTSNFEIKDANATGLTVPTVSVVKNKVTVTNKSKQPSGVEYLITNKTTGATAKNTTGIFSNVKDGSFTIDVYVKSTPTVKKTASFVVNTSKTTADTKNNTALAVGGGLLILLLLGAK